ncbi:hypothetical protein [Paenibacillus macquariensis]|uniref:hypothetical protein n=1 Tax=Paenibacillus macquariensis TaxID=948756 RepID=UPI002DBBC1F5|nr:hypothetical protein [Paenibacillus macquariensis]MEC0094318.1 hypothetical protein [Paenibacillus macquariensis]
MLKKIFLIAFAVTIISGVALSANSTADSYPESVTVNKTVANPVNTDLPLNTVDSVESRLAKMYFGELYTPYGIFVRVYEQSIFKESEIARMLDQIGSNTNQLILECGIFLKGDESTIADSYPQPIIVNETEENPVNTDVPLSSENR